MVHARPPTGAAFSRLMAELTPAAAAFRPLALDCSRRLAARVTSGDVEICRAGAFLWLLAALFPLTEVLPEPELEAWLLAW